MLLTGNFSPKKRGRGHFFLGSKNIASQSRAGILSVTIRLDVCLSDQLSYVGIFLITVQVNKCKHVHREHIGRAGVGTEVGWGRDRDRGRVG